MKTIDVSRIAKEPDQRLAFLEDFTLFSKDDRAALAESIVVLAPKLSAILDALYDHLLSYDDTRRAFLGPHGEMDPNYIAIRKEHLTEWLLRISTAREDGRSLASYLIEVGRRHTAGAGDHQRAVPPRYMVALTSFIQTALWTALFDLLPDQPAKVRRFGLAWNKVLVIQLELFLKTIAPQWPRWDEG